MLFLQRLHRRGFVFSERRASFFSWNSNAPFCALFYVRYCEYSGVHWADSRAEAPSHAACSAVGTLCQPHRSLHTGRERSCHQVGARWIVINATNSHLTAFIWAEIFTLGCFIILLCERMTEPVGSERCLVSTVKCHEHFSKHSVLIKKNIMDNFIISYVVIFACLIHTCISSCFCFIY